MISISTTTANTNGNVIIQESPKSALTEKLARVSRIKTLDGGVYINHSGVSEGDRTFAVTAKISKENAVLLYDIFDIYTTVLIANNEGVFLGVMSDLTIDNGQLKMKIFIKQKEN